MAAALALAGCGSVTSAADPPVDAGAEHELEAAAGEHELAQVDAGAEHELEAAAGDVAGDAPFGGSLVTCAQKVARAGYAAAGAPPCSSCVVNGTNLELKCRAVVDCVASDPHYSPLVATCEMMNEGAEACVSGLLRAAGCGT
jgi:hypothetical protein